MKRTRSDSDSGSCELTHKRRRRSLPAKLPAPTAPKRVAVMGWLGAVPPCANADDQRSDARRERKIATRKRSVSPTKKPTEYRSIFLSKAGVFIDCEFAPPPAAPNLESLAVPPELQLLVDRIVEDYCEECRVSARKGQGEGDWRASASVTVMNKLQRYESFAKVLNVNGSDKPWRTELKPV
ncbi:hypothetical protein DPSP01_014436 [Paraphaeosphaeria sporulosa]